MVDLLLVDMVFITSLQVHKAPGLTFRLANSAKAEKRAGSREIAA